MKNDNTNSYRSTIEEVPVDIIALIKTIWSGRKLIKKIVGVFFIIGITSALLSPVIYLSQTTFVPQTSDQNSTANKGLGSLASLAGINLNAEAASSLDNYISPLLYSKLIDSDEFSVNLLDEELILFNGEKKSVKTFLQEKHSNNTNIFQNAIGFFSKLFSSNKNNILPNHLANFNYISSEDYNLSKLLRNKFSIEANKDDGYIKVLAEDESPLISMQIVKIVTKNLQSKIISLRTSKIKEQLDYSRLQYFEKKKEFETLQNDLAKFKDSNKNISTAVFLSELQSLESEYRLQENILISLASEYNRNKIKLKKDTPIFSVLDEVSIPNVRSKPNRKIIVLTYIFIGLIISIAFILSKDPFRQFILELKKN